MTLDAAEARQVMDIAAQMTRETMRQAQRGSLAQSRKSPGTLISWSIAYDSAEVLVDGDVSPISAVNALGTVVPPGSRVLVEFAPPHGSFLVASLGAPPNRSRTWSPTWSGTSAAVGNSTHWAHYIQEGLKVSFWLSTTFGSSAVMATDILGISLPRTAAGATGRSWPIGFARYVVGGGFYYGTPIISGNLGLDYCYMVYAFDFLGAQVLGNVSTSAPATWATNDTIEVYGTYELAQP